MNTNRPGPNTVAEESRGTRSEVGVENVRCLRGWQQGRGSTALFTEVWGMCPGASCMWSGDLLPCTGRGTTSEPAPSCFSGPRRAPGSRAPTSTVSQGQASESCRDVEWGVQGRRGRLGGAALDLGTLSALLPSLAVPQIGLTGIPSLTSPRLSASPSF